MDGDLQELRSWLLNRVWPRRYPDLERAFENFRRVLEDFQERFRKHAEPKGDGGALLTRKFYQIKEWNPELYEHLATRYEFHVDLVEDLMLELSRAANLICDRVRQFLMRGYRLSEGHLVVQTGPMADFSFHEMVVQYSPQEREREIPYASLDAFLIERAERDRHFGDGTEP